MKHGIFSVTWKQNNKTLENCNPDKESTNKSQKGEQRKKKKKKQEQRWFVTLTSMAWLLQNSAKILRSQG